MIRRSILTLLAVALLSVAATTSAFAQTQTCTPFAQTTEIIFPGATLTYDSSFRCENTPSTGTYFITVTVINAVSSAEAVQIDSLRLSHTTPRPRKRGPMATATTSGLPMTVAPGESRQFTVSGSYELVATDGGGKANLHLRATGQGVSSSTPFRLGINVHLRAPGAVEDDKQDNGGPPDNRGFGRGRRP